MKTLIVYASKYGCTEDCVNILKKSLEGNVNTLNLTKDAVSDISSYDTIIIGGSIYAGFIQKQVKNFCKTFESELLNKHLGLFVCCAAPSNTGEGYLKSSYPESLFNHASAKSTFGGDFRLNKMGFFDKLIINIISKKREQSAPPAINLNNIEQFAKKITV